METPAEHYFLLLVDGVVIAIFVYLVVTWLMSKKQQPRGFEVKPVIPKVTELKERDNDHG